MPRSLIIGPVVVPHQAALRLTQYYDRDEPQNEERMADRTLRWQTLGPRKIETEITGRGTIPPSLEALDVNLAYTLSCIEPVGVLGGTTIALPAARRTDPGSEPHGRAFVGSRVVWTPCIMAGNDALLTPIGGATRYQVLYYPEFEAKLTLGRVTHPRGRLFDWSLTAREV